jgi:PAS domain S-box-containing protein
MRERPPQATYRPHFPGAQRILPVPMPDFRILFESAPGLYLVLLPDDPVFTIVAVSEAYLEATLTKREKIIRRGLFEVFPDNPDDPAATGVANLLASLRLAVAHRRPDTMAVQKYDIPVSTDPADGFEERFWSPVNTPVCRDGEVKYIIHRVEDVTEFVRLRKKDSAAEDLRTHVDRMEAEVFLRAQQVQETNRQLRAANQLLAELRAQDSDKATAALAKSERRYRTLVAATSSLVWTRDRTGAFVEPQPSWSTFTGQSWEECRGFGWMNALHPDDREAMRSRWDEVSRGQGYFEAEARLWKAEAKGYRRFEGRGAPVIGEDGQVDEWVGMVSDIEDRKKLEEQLRHTAKLESLGILAGGIAHDFNNLLTGIMGNASQAIEVFEPRNPADAGLLKNILAASERAAHLTRQMLAYSGKGSFQVKETDLSEMVRGISALLQSSVPRSVHLRLELKDELPCIEADQGQLQQVVMNLIINGAEAIPEGTNGSVAVTTAEQMVDEEYARNFDSTYSLRPGRYVALEVHDSGVGMSEETRRRIFDPFFTTKVHGRGLGLSAVLGIVRGHKGALRVYSEPGRGTTFKVLFPATEGKVEVAQPQREIGRAEGVGTILVVDDEEMILGTIRAILTRRGFQVATAGEGMAAIETLRSTPEISLVILDLTMPKMSGEETLRGLRGIRPTIPVILTSGYNQVEATRKFVGKGLACFLQKPFTVAQLMEAVDQATAC